MRVFRRSVDHDGLLVTASTRVVLRGRHIHLILVLSTRLDDARRLPHNLLVWSVIFGATRELGAIGEAQVELTSIQLHDVVLVRANSSATVSYLLRFLARLDIG